MSDYAEKCPTCQQNYNATEENGKLRAALRKLLKQYQDLEIVFYNVVEVAAQPA